jgi:hypothetical protein
LLNQNVPSILRVAAGAFGFLIFSHAFDGPDLYGALSFFETIPSRRKIAERFGVDPSTVQRISRPFDDASEAA